MRALVEHAVDVVVGTRDELTDPHGAIPGQLADVPMAHAERAQERDALQALGQMLEDLEGLVDGEADLLGIGPTDVACREQTLLLPRLA